MVVDQFPKKGIYRPPIEDFRPANPSREPLEESVDLVRSMEYGMYNGPQSLKIPQNLHY